MRLVLEIILGGGAFLLVCFVVWVAIIYYTVRRAPHKEMYFCQYHGYMPVEDTIQLNSAPIRAAESLGLPLAEQVPICPICFHDTMKKADRGMYLAPDQRLLNK